MFDLRDNLLKIISCGCAIVKTVSAPLKPMTNLNNDYPHSSAEFHIFYSFQTVGTNVDTAKQIKPDVTQ